ncbi:c-type cytochrome biogenesis protein CcsB [Microbacterium oryzae]|uniref:c-type cytochrome biogenesis protein CcsB n=1 Tax=Microbacterium oryzae TaxID=743009 RepID=UPI003F53F7D4
MQLDPVTMDSFSVVLVWTAVSLYVLGFLAYAVDLANRSQASLAARDAAAKSAVAKQLAGVGARGTAGGDAPDVAGASATAAAAAPPRYLWGRIGTSLTWLGFVFHLGATLLRGLAAGRVPWSNMYEFAMTGTLLITAVYLGVLFWRDLRFLGAFMTGIVSLLLGASSLFYVEITPLMDPLKSVWLIIHVFVASLGTAFFALAFAISVLQLLQARRERMAVAATEAPSRRSMLRTIPDAEALEGLAYRFAIIGFIFWTFTLIAGSVWANDAWGRYWGFDTKEVWTFIIWVLYAGYIHARATRGWRGTRSAWLAIVGFAAVLFNFTIVNMFFEGLHAYSGLS